MFEIVDSLKVEEKINKIDDFESIVVWEYVVTVSCFLGFIGFWC